MRTEKKDNRAFDVAIVGGLGHVGLPLGLVFAKKGLKVCLYDIDTEKAILVRRGKMPFLEYGAEPILKNVIKSGVLTVSTDAKDLSMAHHVIIAIGTPMDEYANPQIRSFLEFFGNFKKYLRPDQTIIVRSTVYPHTCRQMMKILGDGRPWRIAYCPERIVQGYAMRELCALPQIVAGLSREAIREAARLFRRIAPKVIEVSMEEAELIKLFTNAWRYIQFAATNQFYMIAHHYGVDYDGLRKAMVEEYGRAASLPGAGFAAGPCLLKDTMQLASFYGNNFHLGHAAIAVNEGLPGFIVEDLRKKYDISKKSVGILGMTFKADIDDTRDSLSYKLGKILRFYGAKVFYSDEYAKDPTFISWEKLIDKSDIIVIGVPHSRYKGLRIPKNKVVVDLWGVTKGGRRA
ncbi:MAG: nucleotide sugar dehydrogenase [Candidatus Omnitrophica bacterium]|nr:nucleotide sugar dehydrogenase [Candidatus Omnitrophota bacterium]